MKKKFLLLILVLAIASISIFIFFLKDWLTIDTCLDRGGRWNEKKQVCEFSEVKNQSP